MKNRIRLFGNLNRAIEPKVPLLIVAIVAVIGFTIVACGDSGSGDSSSPKHKHTWGEWTVTTAPNFTTSTAGEETRTCSECGTSENQAYPIYEIGETGPGSGIIIYRNETAFGSNWHYLEAATTDQATSITWSSTNVDVTGATGTAIGTGKANTAAIIAAHPSDTASNNAAKAANVTIGGKSDWFLPNKDELTEMYKARSYLGISSGFYWSSQQGSINNAGCYIFLTGQEYGYGSKNNPSNVRAVRAF